MLTSYDGQSITYDAIGNPLSYYNGQRYTMRRNNGRQLDEVEVGGKEYTYTYDANGQRMSKTLMNEYTEDMCSVISYAKLVYGKGHRREQPMVVLLD